MNLENTRCDIEELRWMAPLNLNILFMLTNKFYETLKSEIFSEFINFVF